MGTLRLPNGGPKGPHLVAEDHQPSAGARSLALIGGRTFYCCSNVGGQTLYCCSNGVARATEGDSVLVRELQIQLPASTAAAAAL